MIRAVIWKELKDLARDKRTLTVIVGLPLITLPLLGFVTFYLNKEQPSNIAIVSIDESPFTDQFVSELIAWIRAYANAMDQSVNIIVIDSLERALANTTIDYVVILDRGFGENLTSLDKVAFIITSKRIETVRAQTADSIVSFAINSLSKSYAEKRVSNLANKAGVELDPNNVIEPIRKKIRVHKGEGVTAAPQEELRFYTVRFLAFALLFVVMPTITYISDAIMGEKERKTFEALLATPLRVRDLLLGKVIASSILGIGASLADIIGVIIYFYFLQMAFGSSQLVLDAGIIVFHALDVALTVLVTIMLIIPIVVRAGSVRAANVSSSAVLGLAMIIFFATLFVDLGRLPPDIYIPLLFFPYTHSVMALSNFVAGNNFAAFIHLTLLAVFSLVFFIVSLKAFSKEKILMPPSTTG